MADRAKFRPLILHGNRRDKRQSGLRYSRRAAEHRENSPRTLRRGPKALLSLPLREHSPGAFAARGTAILPDNVGNKSYSLGRRQLPSLLALWPYVARHRGMVFAALIALVASAAAMLTVPVAVRRMVDVGFAAHDGGFIDRYFATLIAIGLVLAMASSGRMYAVNWLGERVVADLRSDVFRHLATLGPPFYDRTHSGEVMSRLTADTTQIKGAAGSALSQALRNLIMLIGALTMMFVTSPTLAALGLAAIPVIVFPMLAYGRAVRRLSRTAQDRLADASAYAAENLGAVRTMHAFGQQTTVSRRFADASERAFDAARSRLLARAGLTAIAICLIVSSIVGILWFGSRLVVAGEISGGRLSQFVLYAMFAAGAIAELSEVWGEISQAAGAAERLLELLSVRSEIVEPSSRNPCRRRLSAPSPSGMFASRIPRDPIVQRSIA